MAYEDRYNRAQFPVTLGVPVVFNLNAGAKILRGNVIVKGSVTISGGTTNGAPIAEGGPLNLIRRITVIANKAAGSRYVGGNLVRCIPQTLVRYAMIQHQGKLVIEQSGSTLGGGAAGTYPIYMNIPIYFADAVNLNQVSTALNMDPVDSTGAPIYTAVQVQVEFAQYLTELFSGSDRTIGVNLMCQWRDDRLALSTDTVPLKQEDHIAIIQAANTEFVDAAMPNDGAFSAWLLLAQQGQPGLALSDAIINKLTIKGSALNYMEYYQDIRQQMIDDGFYDPSSTLTGQFHLDWTHGVLQNSNVAAGLQHQIDLNNPSGAGLDQLRIYTRRVFALPASGS